MARMGFDTRSQNAWKELIEKESVTRISWHQKFDPTSSNKDDQWFTRAFYTQAASKPITGHLPKLVFPPRPKRPANNSETLEQLREKLHLQDNPDALKEMYPVREEQKDLLYDGISKEDKGRHRYLNVRQRMAPDQKYQYPVASSMEYGWKLDETMHLFQTPIHARSKLIEESFYRTHGAF